MFVCCSYVFFNSSFSWMNSRPIWCDVITGANRHLKRKCFHLPQDMSFNVSVFTVQWPPHPPNRHALLHTLPVRTRLTRRPRPQDDQLKVFRFLRANVIVL